MGDTGEGRDQKSENIGDIIYYYYCWLSTLIRLVMRIISEGNYANLYHQFVLCIVGKHHYYFQLLSNANYTIAKYYIMHKNNLGIHF